MVRTAPTTGIEVESRRGALVIAGACAAAPQSGLPWPRFPSPLIEPDLLISGIRLCASEGKKHLPSITATSALGTSATCAALP